MSVCEPTLRGNEKRYVLECLEKNWISSHGEFVLKFEEAFAKTVNAKYGIACSSGTAAVHMALAALHLEPGDEVILPAFTMIATVNPIMFVGAKPVLVDSEPNSWNMNVDEVAKKITKRTKVILPVHIYGHPVDMDPILDLAKKHKLHVLEDAAEAHGALYKGKIVGKLGSMGAFSFFANKIITSGEGGMVVTDDPEVADYTRGFRNYAFSKDIHFWHRFIGYNYRMTNLQAAIGLAQLEQLDQFVEDRRKNAMLYTEYLKKIPGIATPPEGPDVKSVFWMYGILVDKPYPLTRDQLRQHLAKHGIETRSFFIPIHWQKPFQEMFRGERYPVAEDLCARGFYLPSSSSLTKEQIEFVCDVVRNPMV
ncbi:MAG: aminotransferase DegT [Deltaproteobacteria bacterium RIFCSPLOWO2_01_44_7]|nr:MAG: aminotransferase DegT [Deltaproteobacteria bacterium RIFCSPHIGHO2_01_FULL_43_49]OGQ15314.1 MAG: aminotransferase DegT [Deltaproteobacteria bacterium RIFCSPHIGHO2_02_FULL_44_53]OGQ27380.1 MAG: aminotransferase DegT [Deltaproteobacteria bacterium RIFCSPHIGHO2_12_FULL_44_21]OGQ31830.1 MAG: aminotransferase DegT [Deltaproteobacteria bacterium RIFCSPLOWO2_01_FULL_45_74]OGQ39022.1 MAG: aminotransferase DegT [Deltaproteobacteria bacterium RIFCSPLOWO2_01_44_7]OGQ43032.1 MAG: aminotransferase D